MNTKKKIILLGIFLILSLGIAIATGLNQTNNTSKVLTTANACNWLGITPSDQTLILTTGLPSTHTLGEMPSDEEPLADAAIGCPNLGNETICAGTDSCEWYGCDGTLDCSGYSAVCGGGDCVNPQHASSCEQYFIACTGEISCADACPFEGEDFKSCCIAHGETCIYQGKCYGTVDCSALDYSTCIDGMMSGLCYWDGTCQTEPTAVCDPIGSNPPCTYLGCNWQEASSCSGIASCGNEFPGETECCQASVYLTCAASYSCQNQSGASCHDTTTETPCTNYYGCTWQTTLIGDAECTGTLNATNC